MQRRTISKYSRCLPTHVPKILIPLLIIALLTVIITIVSKDFYPDIIFTTTHNQIISPSFLHNHISNLQIQVGNLLQKLHNESPDSKTAKDYANLVLKIAVSLDKLADSLFHIQREPPIERIDMSNVKIDASDSMEDEANEELPNERAFNSAEVRNYTSPKPNRHHAKNFFGVEAVYPSIGLSCVGTPTNLNRYMSYKIYGTCPDDWILAQKLIVSGCDPLPRRRCFAKSPPHYTRPLSINSSLWTLPSDTNILWTNYKCTSFSCLVSNETVGKRGYFKCSNCFDLSKRGWETPSDRMSSAEFTADEVLQLRPGEIRIGLDFSVTTGTFAAIMKERNVTIISATLNLGAPFSEVIALRGLIPLYVSIGSRLPFFDNTLGIVHSALLDGWIGFELLQYVLLDWDRVLRPRGLLWVDRFFCGKNDMELYLEEFSRLRYKKLMWRVVPKTDKEGDELFFSAVLEKPLRV